MQDLFPGTWYLVSVDDKHRRMYDRKPLAAAPGDSPISAQDIQVRREAFSLVKLRKPHPFAT